MSKHLRGITYQLVFLKGRFGTHIVSNIYINHLPKGITSICKIFAGNTSQLSKIENKDLSAVQMNEDLKAISNWVYQEKILFKADPNKQAIKLCFLQKYVFYSHF